MVAAAISTRPAHPKTSLNHHNHHQNPPNPSRTPLLPSEIDNGVSTASTNPPATTRPNSRYIPSRYMSSSSCASPSSSCSSFSSSFRRFPSPLISRSFTPSQPSVPKRSQSAERRRPVTPRSTTPLSDFRSQETSAATKVLRTSCRSLSVSFQGESFSLPISKVKTAPATTPLPQPSLRKATPERRRTMSAAVPCRRDQLENSKPVEQQRWPARNRQVDPPTRSLDYGNEKMGLGATLHQSGFDRGRQIPFDGRMGAEFCNADLDNGLAATCDLTGSDTDSVSSSSNSGTQEFGGISRGRATPRAVSVPARFLQEANAWLRLPQEPRSPLLRTTTQPKLVPSKMAVADSPISSPCATGQMLSSPLRGPVRAPSPSKLLSSSLSTPASSPSRGMPSPSRMRSSSVSSDSNINPPSILSFAADIRRGKMGENRIEDAHLLRLFYNRHLQWRFVNARAGAAMIVQSLMAEKNLYNAWVTTSELRDFVTAKRIQLQLLKQNSKLSAILKQQLSYLEEWTFMDGDHSSSLSGAIEALKASTLRLPVIDGARADVQEVKDAVCSAVDVMQAMGSSICSLLSKFEGMNSLAIELSNVAIQEQVLLTQCRHLLSTIAAMQVEQCSLRTHLLQLRRRSNLTQL